LSRYKKLVTFIRNNRIEEYRTILKKALDLKYSVISLKDYIGTFSQKTFILRHDIDYPSKATLMMFEIEKELGVTASYYFRKSSYDINLMKEIEKYGSEASLHFETVSDYAKSKSIFTKSELEKYNWKSECLSNLKNELKFLRTNYNLKCETIASHGDPRNNLIETANYFLTYEKEAYTNLDIKFEAYNEDFIDSLDAYISDDSPEINNGYRYHNNPISEIEKGCPKILFLTHPNHWYWDNYTKLKKIIKLIIKGETDKKIDFELF
jgi:hypothetical protein